MQMKLMLSIPIDHESVSENGLLQEKRLEVGPIAIVIGSVMAHQCDGYVILNHNIPPISISQIGFLSEGMLEADFSVRFDAALQVAKLHASRVTEWIEAEIEKEILRREEQQ